MTTTPAAIRASMIAAVRALTPTSLSSRKFLPYTQSAPFIEWCEKHPLASFRLFQVRRIFDEEGIEVSNTDVREIHARWELLVAYPINNQYAKDSGQPGLALDDVLEEDKELIDRAAGSEGYANYSATAVLTESKSVDFGEKVAFIRLQIWTPHYQAAA